MQATLVDEKIPRCNLGESPCWDAPSRSLYWVDIEGKTIYRYWPQTAQLKIYKSPKMVPFVLPLDDHMVLAGLQDGVYTADLEHSRYDLYAPLPDDPATIRLNDGKCDPAGRIWAGTMPLDESSEQKIGGLYRLEAGKLSLRDNGFGVANGKAWDRDRGIMYHADTTSKTIWKYAYDAERGTIQRSEIFLKLEDAPDGLCIGASGSLYIALYGGGRVEIYDPLARLQDAVQVPTPNVTCCAFGGEGLDILYITTASEDGDDFSGSLFQVKVNERGFEEARAAL